MFLDVPFLDGNRAAVDNPTDDLRHEDIILGTPLVAAPATEKTNVVIATGVILENTVQEDLVDHDLPPGLW
ncbi:hypothetical protein DRN32_06460 [Thermococci archaeon]|nr:MAG: hypothetical protein DRN32_06460 [Thermococci archaeon]